MAAKKDYGAESIKVLEGLEGVRRRPRNVYWLNRERRTSSSDLRSC